MRIPESVIDWLGDGRKMQLPPANAIGHPRAVRLGTAKVIAAEFVEAGHSNHSSMGSLVWVVMDYCASQAIPYDLTVHVDAYGTVMGYSIVRKPALY
jgi:hypothetical protein